MTKQKMLEFYQQMEIQRKFETNQKNMDAFVPIIIGYTSKNKFKCLNNPMENTIQKQTEKFVGGCGCGVFSVKFQPIL